MSKVPLETNVTNVTIYYQSISLPCSVPQGEEPILVVGTGPQNQRWGVLGDHIAAALHAEGISYRRAPQQSWVRNEWVYFLSTKTYVPAQHIPAPLLSLTPYTNNSLIGDGGMVVGEQGPFMLLSESCDYLYPEHVRQLLEARSGIRTYLVPSLNESQKDIDVVLCPIPFARKLVVDSSYYQRERKIIEGIAEVEDLDILVTDEKYAPNCIVLDTLEAQGVITYATPHFAAQLRETGIPVIEVREASIDHLYAGGGARCFTNVVHPSLFSNIASRSWYALLRKRQFHLLDIQTDLEHNLATAVRAP
ncbi:MAG: hypothetical protein AABX37_01785 [Nanoarchaeota archaeon]